MRFVFVFSLFLVSFGICLPLSAQGEMNGYEPPSMFGDDVPEPVQIYEPYRASPDFPYPVPLRKPVYSKASSVSADDGKDFQREHVGDKAALEAAVPLPPQRPARFYASKSFIESARRGALNRSETMSGRELLELLEE